MNNETKEILKAYNHYGKTGNDKRIRKLTKDDTYLETIYPKTVLREVCKEIKKREFGNDLFTAKP